MNNIKNDAIKVEYDGMRNITYEKLKRGVIYADIGHDKQGDDLIVDIVPARHYDGRELNSNAKIGFRISFKSHYHSPDLGDKIVIDFDSERLEIEANKGKISEESYRDFEEEISFSSDELGTQGSMIECYSFETIEFDLQPNEIKRIADAKNVNVYFDSNGAYNFNGGSIVMRNGLVVKIEGIQNVLKRTYHIFVDETYYADYFEKKQKALKEAKQKAEAEKKAHEQLIIQQEQEASEQEASGSKRRIVILLVSIVLVVLGFIINTWWLSFLAGIVGLVCICMSKRFNKYYKDFMDGYNGVQR